MKSLGSEASIELMVHWVKLGAKLWLQGVVFISWISLKGTFLLPLGGQNMAGKSIVDGLPAGHGPFRCATAAHVDPARLGSTTWPHEHHLHMLINMPNHVHNWGYCSAIIYRNLYLSDCACQSLIRQIIIESFVTSSIIGEMPHVANSLMNHQLFSVSLIWVMSICI